MNEENFYKTFWTTYIQIENELIDIFKYVDLSLDNYKTYSSKFLKIFLQIGSEIDICFKEYLKFFQANNVSAIGGYKQQLKSHDSDFFDEIIEIKQINTTIKPWENLKKHDSISWWTAYNKVKHKRTEKVSIDGITQESYKFADLENVIISLSGLYSLLMNMFSKIKGNRDDSPIPNSKLFIMKSRRWSNCKYFNIMYASVGNDGDMYLDSTVNHLIY